VEVRARAREASWPANTVVYLRQLLTQVVGGYGDEVGGEEGRGNIP